MSRKMLLSPLLVIGISIISLMYSPVTSFASLDNLTITSNGDSAKMRFKATNENGKTVEVSDFSLNADNVLFIEEDDKGHCYG